MAYYFMTKLFLKTCQKTGDYNSKAILEKQINRRNGWTNSVKLLQVCWIYVC